MKSNIVTTIFCACFFSISLAPNLFSLNIDLISNGTHIALTGDQQQIEIYRQFLKYIETNDLNNTLTMLDNQDLINILTATPDSLFTLTNHAFKIAFYHAVSIHDMQPAVEKLINIHPIKDKSEILEELINYTLIKKIIKNGYVNVLDYLLKLDAANILRDQSKYPVFFDTNPPPRHPLSSLQQYAKKHNQRQIARILEEEVKKVELKDYTLKELFIKYLI